MFHGDFSPLRSKLSNGKDMWMIGNRTGKHKQYSRRLNGPSRTRNGCCPDRFHRAGQSALKNTSPAGNRGTRFASRRGEMDGHSTTEAQAIADMLQDSSIEQSQQSRKVRPAHLENSQRLARLEAL